MPEAAGTRGLTAIEARVVGALLEKELTTPDAYPLTLKALIAACNQSSNRSPVVDYGNHEVENTVLALKAKGLARVVRPGSGERATRYRQVVDEAFGLTPADRALVCVLLLRGAQTAPELKARTARLHAFPSAVEVEARLQALARRDPPLVARIDRRPGQKEDRWIQLLEVGAEERAAAVTPAAVSTTGPKAGRMEELEGRVATLETRLASLVEALDGLVDVRRPTEGTRKAKRSGARTVGSEVEVEIWSDVVCPWSTSASAGSRGELIGVADVHRCSDGATLLWRPEQSITSRRRGGRRPSGRSQWLPPT